MSNVQTGNFGQGRGPDGRELASGNGGGGRYDRLEARLGEVEKSLVRLDTRLDTVATREWILWRAFVLIGFAITIGIGLASIITFALVRLSD